MAGKSVTDGGSGGRIYFSEQYARHLAKFTKMEEGPLLEAVVEYLSTDCSQRKLAIKFGVKQGKISIRVNKLIQLDGFVVEALEIRNVRIT